MNFQGMYEDHDQQQHAPATGTATADIDLTGTVNDSNPLQIQSSISATSSASTSTSNSVSNLKSNGLRNPSAEVQGVERMSNISGSGMANNSKSESVKAGQQDQVDVNVNVDANGNTKIEGERTESETAMEERLVAENCRQITQDATDKLHSALQRIKNVTKSMLSEMEVYLESAQSVEIEYVRCQHSQRKEGMRLMDVEPDITGTTSSLKFGMS